MDFNIYTNENHFDKFKILFHFTNDIGDILNNGFNSYVGSNYKNIELLAVEFKIFAVSQILKELDRSSSDLLFSGDFGGFLVKFLVGKHGHLFSSDGEEKVDRKVYYYKYSKNLNDDLWTMIRCANVAKVAKFELDYPSSLSIIFENKGKRENFEKYVDIILRKLNFTFQTIYADFNSLLECPNESLKRKLASGMKY